MLWIFLLFSKLTLAQSYPPPAPPPPAIQYRLPNPATATMLSAEIGFGTGHFYSHRPIAGTTHLVIQTGALTLSAYGLVSLISDINSNLNTLDVSIPSVQINEDGTIDGSVKMKYQSDPIDTRLDTYLLITGISTYLIDHAVDTITAQVSAKKTGLEMINNRFNKRLERKGLK